MNSRIWRAYRRVSDMVVLWLRPWSRHDVDDEAYERCETEFDELAGLLRREADAWAECQSSKVFRGGEPVGSTTYRDRKQSSRSRWGGRMLAVSASLATMMVLWKMQATPTTNRDLAPRIVAAADARQVNQEIGALAEVCLESMRSLESSLSTASHLKSDSLLNTDVAQLREAVVKPVESLSRGYGKALAFIANREHMGED